MSALAETLYTTRIVHTVGNYTAFVKWCQETADEDQLDAAFAVCYEVLHDLPDPHYEANCHKEPLIIRRPDLGRQWTLRQIRCTEVRCERCNSWQGGWSFRWIGPWTCPTLVGDALTPAEEIVRRASECDCGWHGQA